MNMKGISTIVFLIFTLQGYSQSQSKLEISHLTGDFYVYTTYKEFNGTVFPSNSMYLLTSEGAVLFDTPWDSTQFQPLLDSISYRHGQKVIMCISTHFHDDRTEGLEFYKQKGIKTYSSRQTYDLCAANNNKQAEFYFTKDTVFTVGEHTFQTYYPGKGHTEDNIVIYSAQHRILYGGCLIKSTENKDLGNISDANLEEWPQSIQNLIEKFGRPAYVIPGHFSWKNNKALKHTLKLLRKNI